MRKVLVCGSRDWNESGIVSALLDGLLARWKGEVTVIEGGADGADFIARSWADGVGAHLVSIPADWESHGNAAGPIRNRRMLTEGKPDIVLAFRNNGESKGTDDMVKAAVAAGVPTYVIRRANG